MFKYSKFPSCQILKSSKFSYHQNFKSSNPQSPEITKFSKSSNYQILIHLKSFKYSNPLKLQILEILKSPNFPTFNFLKFSLFLKPRIRQIVEIFKSLNPRHPRNPQVIEILKSVKSFHQLLKSSKSLNLQISNLHILQILKLPIPQILKP